MKDSKRMPKITIEALEKEANIAFEHYTTNYQNHQNEKDISSEELAKQLTAQYASMIYQKLEKRRQLLR
jgi:hypothetical protein